MGILDTLKFWKKKPPVPVLQPEPTPDPNAAWTAAMNARIAELREQEENGATESLRAKRRAAREALEFARDHP